MNRLTTLLLAIALLPFLIVSVATAHLVLTDHLTLSYFKDFVDWAGFVVVCLLGGALPAVIAFHLRRGHATRRRYVQAIVLIPLCFAFAVLAVKLFGETVPEKYSCQGLGEPPEILY